MARLFISHASANNAQAVALLAWLNENGWDDVFLDFDAKRGIAAGDRWERKLNEAARRCEAVLFLFSRAWLSSPWCEREFNLAYRLNKRLFGILIEDLAVDQIPASFTSMWQIVQLALGSDSVVFEVALPITGTRTSVSFSAEGLNRLKGGLKLAGLDPRFFEWPPADDQERSPYPGFNALEAEDAGIFFGRDAEIIEALDKLRGLREGAPPRLSVILGASGAGKSSFLRAGLWPRLKRDDQSFLPLPIIRPGKSVLFGEFGLVASLTRAFDEVGAPRERNDIAHAVAASGESIVALFDELVGVSAPQSDSGRYSPPSIVISIDQAEELFLTDGMDEARKFLSLLRTVLLLSNPSVISIMAMRSDRFASLQSETELDQVALQPFNLPPLAKGAFHDVIVGPARRLAEF